MAVGYTGSRTNVGVGKVSQQFSLLYLLQFSILSLLVRRSSVSANGGAKCCCYRFISVCDAAQNMIIGCRHHLEPLEPPFSLLTPPSPRLLLLHLPVLLLRLRITTATSLSLSLSLSLSQLLQRCHKQQQAASAAQQANTRSFAESSNAAKRAKLQ